jgi:hypothetical protein
MLFLPGECFSLVSVLTARPGFVVKTLVTEDVIEGCFFLSRIAEDLVGYITRGTTF